MFTTKLENWKTEPIHYVQSNKKFVRINVNGKSAQKSGSIATLHGNAYPLNEE